MTYHIVGSSGYIAGKILARTESHMDIVKYSPDRGEDEVYLDLTQRDETVFKDIKKGDFVIFLAAISSPDVCDKNYDLAYSINVEGTKWFIQECTKRGANVLFLSSDTVNGATESAVDEDSIPEPFGKYAVMKREIELFFENDKHVKIFRLSYVFSRQDKFMSYMESCVKNDETAEVFDALYRNVVYVEDIIDAVFALASTYDTWNNYIFNLSGSELLSRYMLATLYKNNINSSIKIAIATPPNGFFDARPNIIETNTKYTELLLGREMTLIGNAMKKEFI